MADLLRQSVYGRLTGYEYLHDAERLAAALTFRLISLQVILDGAACVGVNRSTCLPDEETRDRSTTSMTTSFYILGYIFRSGSRPEVLPASLNCAGQTLASTSAVATL
jgi:hypothetical protein